MSDQKNGEKSDRLRDKGNLQFQSGLCLEALIFYNKSLCYALPETSQIALAYANRSAVYLKAKLFHKCLENIELARKCGYPADKLQKLDEREERCKKLIENHKIHLENDPRNYFFKLSYPPNEKIPFVANCLELRKDEKYGRYVVTNINLKPGDIIAIDEPVYKFVNKEVFDRHCANCLKSNDLSLIPCLSCTYTMYCSESCKQEHEKLIHRLECGGEPFSESFAMATKMTLNALSVAGSVENLQNLLKSSTFKTVYDLDLSGAVDELYRKNAMLVINALTTVRETDFTKTNPLNELFEKSPFDSLLKTEDDRKFMKTFTRDQLRILDTNLYDMKEHSRVNLSQQTFGQSVGSGLFLFASLFSHSCDALVKRITVDNKIAFVVVRPVAAGEQLYISYGYSSYAMSRDMRRSHLRSYGFICDCKACSSNYLQLSQQRRMIREYEEADHEEMTAQTAIAAFEKACRFIKKIINYHPCYETTDMMIYCDHLLHQISKLPLEEIGKAKR